MKWRVSYESFNIGALLVLCAGLVIGCVAGVVWGFFQDPLLTGVVVGGIGLFFLAAYGLALAIERDER